MCAYIQSVLRHTRVSVSHLRVYAHGCVCVNLYILTSAQPCPANGPQGDCIHQGTCLQSSLRSGSLSCVHLVKLGGHWPSPVSFGFLGRLTRAKHPAATEKSLAHSNCSLPQVKKHALGSFLGDGDSYSRSRSGCPEPLTSSLLIPGAVPMCPPCCSDPLSCSPSTRQWP